MDSTDPLPGSAEGQLSQAICDSDGSDEEADLFQDPVVSQMTNLSIGDRHGEDSHASTDHMPRNAYLKKKKSSKKMKSKRAMK